MTETQYDIIVIGAGHAGCEAAYVSAKMGSKVLLITMDMSKIAQMSCNPAIGGIAKGQIVKEIDALGGGMGIVTDKSTIQFRMLNRSKGAAMWSPRAQCDRMLYSSIWRHILENTSGLDLWQDSVTSFLFDGLKITGVTTGLGVIFKSKAVIITSGTFLNGKLFVGQQEVEGGRIGEMSSVGLTEQLNSFGIKSGRMKTGTPPRIDIRYVDTDRLLIQTGDSSPERFSFLPYLSPIQKGKKQRECYIVHTNKSVHDTLKSAFHLSPLFMGRISGIGPRYCPSIEDKLKTFADKDQHQLFLEPEGWNTNEYYLQGFSSSLPYQTQIEALRKIEGFANVKVYRPAYAVEYDYFPPEQLNNTLESKIISNLYFAGQVNGTTGYEEAAAQGLIAGVNAHLKLTEKDPFILKRDEAYIGVLIDDLINKGVDEPYRMFTSRAEYRILLRQDDADLRLTQKSYEIGLSSEERALYTQKKYHLIENIEKVFQSEKIPLENINEYFAKNQISEITQNKSIADILLRPQVDIFSLIPFVPRGTFSFDQAIDELAKQIYQFSSVKDSLNSLIDSVFSVQKDFNNDSIETESDLYKAINDFFTEQKSDNNVELDLLCDTLRLLLVSTEIRIKYKGYIDRERKNVEKLKRLEGIKIPNDFDYEKVLSLSIESRQKLQRIKPDTIAEASRIPGVSPADISVLLVFFGR